jgi:ATP-dependent DNA helicase RecQ
MADKKPVYLSDLAGISGLGEFKIKKYGKTFVNEIKSWLKENDVKAPKSDTYKETLSLLKQGFSIEEIASTRQLHENTIYSHIALLYVRDEINSIDKFIQESDLVLVKNAVEQTGEKKQLAPLFQFLEEKVPYHIIRLCLAQIEKENKQNN